MGDSYMSSNDRTGYVRGAVSVGEFSFIGDSVIIFPGVVIGRGCLIKACSVVTKSVPDLSIVSGVPAEVEGSVLDIDRKYLADTFVRETYFDHSLIDR